MRWEDAVGSLETKGQGCILRWMCLSVCLSLSSCFSKLINYSYFYHNVAAPSTHPRLTKHNQPSVIKHDLLQLSPAVSHTDSLFSLCFGTSWRLRSGTQIWQTITCCFNILIKHHTPPSLFVTTSVLYPHRLCSLYNDGCLRRMDGCVVISAYMS